MGGSQTTNEIGGLENFPKINNQEGEGGGADYSVQ